MRVNADYRLEPAAQRLVEDNRGLAHFVVKQLWGKEVIKRAYLNDEEEAVSVAYEALCKAAYYFNPERGKFSTFAVLIMRRAVTGEAHARGRAIRIPEHAWRAGKGVECQPLGDYEPPAQGPEPVDLAEQSEQRSILGGALRELSECEQQVLQRVFVRGESHSAAAKAMGCSHEYVRLVKEKALASLREMVQIHSLLPEC
jgi:RNA polymerase sigma factor (sigma-70 family)